MPAYEELNTLVEQVNAEVAELDAAELAKDQAQEILEAAKVVVAQEEAQVETKLDALLVAVQARLEQLRGTPIPPPV